MQNQLGVIEDRGITYTRVGEFRIEGRTGNGGWSMVVEVYYCGKCAALTTHVWPHTDWHEANVHAITHGGWDGS